MKYLKKVTLAALMFSAFHMIHAADGDSANAEPCLKSPILLSATAPVYPRDARARALEGTVIIEATVMTDGRLGQAKITSSVHPILDRAALETVAKWRFAPAPDAKDRVTKVRLPVNYVIETKSIL